MVDQELANHYRGNIIDLATMIEANIDKFFLEFFVEEGDDVRMSLAIPDVLQGIRNS